MRILQIVNPATPIPPATMGGGERIVYSLLVELQKLGHEVTLLGEDTSEPQSAWSSSESGRIGIRSGPFRRCGGT